MRLAGDGVPRPPAPKPKPVAAKPPKPFVLKTPHDVGTTARPPRRGHAPTVFQQPLSQTPPQRMVAQQRRHLARGVLHAVGGPVPNRPLKKTEVDAVLAHPETQDLLRSTLPFIPKESPHHSLIHNILHTVASVPAALTARPNPNNPIRQTVFSQKQGNSADKAIQKALGSLNEVPAALTARPNPNNPLAPIGTKLTNKVEKAVGGELKAIRKGANKYNQHNTASLGPSGGKVNPTVAKELKAGAKDIISTPANAIQSAYLAATHPGEVAKSMLEQAKHPLKSLEQHPVNTALILRGGEAALSRGAGDVARSGALGRGAKEFASTERKPLKLVGNATVQRRASKGLIENRVQKAVDQRAVRKGRGTTVTERGQQVPAIQATEKQMLKPALGRPLSGHLNRRVDQEVGTNAGMLHIRRSKVLQVMHEAGKSVKGHEDAVPLVMEGILKEGDTKTTGRVQRALEAERERLRANAHGLEPADAKLNAENIQRIDGLLKSKEFLANPHHVFDITRQIANSQRAFDALRVKFGDFEKGAAERRVLLPFAERELGLKYNEDTKRFEDPNGHAVSNEQIRNEFKARGGNPEHLGYVPRFKDVNVPKNFRGGAGGMLRRPGASQRYTGADTHTGAYHRSFVALAEQMAHTGARVERHQGMNDLVNLFSHKAQGGHYFDSLHAAQKEARNLRDSGAGEYVPVNIARKSAPDSLMQELTPAEFEHNYHKAGPTDSHVVLFPKAVWERVQAHENLRDKVTPEFQTATRYFRHAVLPTSPRWFAGNVLEAALRTAINDPTLARSMYGGHHLTKELAHLGPKGERALERLQAGAAAGHFGSQKYMDYFRPEDERNVMNVVHAFRQAPGPKQIGNLWDTYSRVVFAVNQRAESSVYYGALGKEAQREIQSTLGAWHKTINLASPAYQDVAKGLLDSNNVARYVREVDKMRGRYANLSPRGRKYVTGYTPFAPWYANAIHFWAVTMPAQHPVLTAALAGLVQGTDKQRKAMNLKPWEEGNIGGVDVNRFTPGGIFQHGPSEPAVLSNLHGLVLPQLLPPLLNLTGHDWTLKQLPKGASPMLVALNTAAESFIPFLSAGRRLREKGGTSIPGSTIVGPKVKAGTQQKSTLNVLGKVFLPGYPQKTAPKPKTGLPSAEEILGGTTKGAKLPSAEQIIGAH